MGNGSNLYRTDLEDKAIEILKFMGENRLRYFRDDLSGILDYMTCMLKDERVLTVEFNNVLNTVVLFSICDDFEPFYKKKTWEYLPHNPNGGIVYIEKAVSVDWRKDARNRVKEVFLTKYPNLEIAKWHRWARWGDREVTIRRSHEYSSQYSF